MVLKLYPAIPTHVDRISEIHMAAFASNAMLLAQFPTLEAREGLRESIRLKALADIEDSKITVLVVRDAPQDSDTPSISGVKSAYNELNNRESQVGELIAFAKWSHPVGKDEEYEETPWIWPSGTNMNILESWGKATEEAQELTVGHQPCYRLTFMGTDPSHERRGAASMMVRWGLDHCRMENVVGYLESTLDAAPFYEKMGFVTSRRISLQYQVEHQNQDEVYEELAFVYHPTAQ